MPAYLVCRLLQGALVLLLVSLTIFALIRSVPAGTLLLQLNQAAALSPEELARARQELALERPFWQQYALWLGGALHGDLGHSLTSHQPVSQELATRLALTLHLASMALSVALLSALPLGLVSAVWPHRLIDYCGRMLALAGLSLPDFWMATVAITCMALWWHWVPPVGFAPLWSDPATCVEQLLIPAIIIGARLSAELMRLTRSALLEVLRQDYIRTARAKGLHERTVILRHGLKNVCLPVLTLVAQRFSVLLSGTVIVEVIFLLPGLGSLTLDAVMLRDYTMIQGVVMFFAVVIVGMNLLVDLSYAWCNPRIRYT